MRLCSIIYFCVASGVLPVVVLACAIFFAPVSGFAGMYATETDLSVRSGAQPIWYAVLECCRALNVFVMLHEGRADKHRLTVPALKPRPLPDVASVSYLVAGC